MRMTVAEYVAQLLIQNHITDVFTITGGGAMHLNNALGKNKGLNCYYNHHEQGCSMAAESYARLTGNIAAVCVTSGPGGTNAITGVLGGWLDSLPMLIISGQVRFDTTVRSTDLPLRQLGDQEFDITKCVSSLTKYAEMIVDPMTIRYHIEKAIYLAKAGRPGPCWIDIPLNIQGATIETDDLKGFSPDGEETNPVVNPSVYRDILKMIKESKRPVLFAGSGIRIADGYDDFLKLVDYLKIPVVTAWNAHDVLWNDHSYYFGRPGTIGDRAGNFIVQNADLLIVLGCRLNIRQISYNWENFAKNAYKVIVDIDENELKKPTIKPDLAVKAHLKTFLTDFNTILAKADLPVNKDWLSWCKERKDKYPVVLKEYWDLKEQINPYCFVETLFGHLNSESIIVTANGSACVCTFQAAFIKKGQRLYTNSGCASMGYDIPAAIGACVAAKKEVICIAGDGSMMMNLQELQTIVGYHLPIKIILLNNNGYHSIRQTQHNFFGSPLVGCDPESGVTFPDFNKIANAFGIPYYCCTSHADMDSVLTAALAEKGPVICEVVLTTEQFFAPKLSSKKLPDGTMISAPLEDMFPFLDEEEFNSNLIK